MPDQAQSLPLITSRYLCLTVGADMPPYERKAGEHFLATPVGRGDGPGALAAALRWEADRTDGFPDLASPTLANAIDMACGSAADAIAASPFLRLRDLFTGESEEMVCRVWIVVTVAPARRPLIVGCSFGGYWIEWPEAGRGYATTLAGANSQVCARVATLLRAKAPLQAELDALLGATVAVPGGMKPLADALANSTLEEVA